jgi:disulfide bond formation protein DsbB
LLLVMVLLVRVFRKGPVSGSRIQGAIAAYLMLGLGWAHAYAILASHHPHAFATTQAAPATPAAWTYFSFTTLTTVGYGDIVPTAPVARTLAMGEAFAGQLYLAVLVARLVALQVAAGPASREVKED